MGTPLKILITSQKGGVGKSTVSANLAAFFAHVSSKKTTLVDLDHQGTAGKWVRNAAPIGIECISVASPNNKGVGMALLQAQLPPMVLAGDVVTPQEADDVLRLGLPLLAGRPV